MDVEPAHVNQVRLAEDGQLFEVSADVGCVADDLRKIDAGFKVRFSERGRTFIVYHEHHDGCPRNGDGGPGSTYLVTSCKAHQGRSGVWEGLDQRLVRRIEQIGSEQYDYAGELEKATRRAHANKKAKTREHLEGMAELAAHAIRKDLGARYQGRAFIPRDVPA